VIRTKFGILEVLSNAGYTTYQLRKNKVFGESVLQKFRTGGIPSKEELNRLCYLLEMQPGDILEYVPDDQPPADELPPER